jgi:hypothetical protein
MIVNKEQERKSKVEVHCSLSKIQSKHSSAGTEES